MGENGCPWISALLLLVIAGCAGSTIPRDDFDRIVPCEGCRYEVQRTDGTTIVTSAFAVTGDSVVVFDDAGTGSGATNPARAIIPLSGIVSIRQVSPSGHGKAIVIGLVAVAVFVVVGRWLVDNAW